MERVTKKSLLKISDQIIDWSKKKEAKGVKHKDK